jgi:hypothetical protein
MSGLREEDFFRVDYFLPDRIRHDPINPKESLEKVKKYSIPDF